MADSLIRTGADETLIRPAGLGSIKMNNANISQGRAAAAGSAKRARTRMHSVRACADVAGMGTSRAARRDT